MDVWMVNFTPQPLSFRRDLRYPLDRRLWGFQRYSGRFGGGEISWPCRESNHNSSVVYMTALSLNRLRNTKVKFRYLKFSRRVLWHFCFLDVMLCSSVTTWFLIPKLAVSNSEVEASEQQRLVWKPINKLSVSKTRGHLYETPEIFRYKIQFWK
jgi:hypothetical protein